MTDATPSEPSPYGEDVSVPDMFAVPAPFINRFFVSGMGTNLRITFGEQEIPAGTTHIRSAVVMLTSDAIQLRDLLTRLIVEVRLTETAQTAENG